MELEPKGNGERREGRDWGESEIHEGSEGAEVGECQVSRVVSGVLLS